MFKKFIFALIGAFFISNSADAEIKTYEGIGEYVMSDFEIPDVAKQRAKQRAEADAQEKAGIFVKSNTKVVDAQINSDEIEVMTAGIMKIRSVIYDVRTDISGFVFTAKILADIDTEKIDEWLQMNETTKQELLEQNNSLKKSLAEQEKQLDELKKKLSDVEQNKSVELSSTLRMQMTRDFSETENIFLSSDRLKAGNAAYLQGNFYDAINFYSEALDLNPKNIFAYIYRGSSYASLKNFKNAEQDYISAIQIDNKNSTAHMGLGAVYFYEKNFNSAIQELNEAIRLDNRNGQAYYTRACVFSALNMNFEARYDFSMAKRCGYKN